MEEILSRQLLVGILAAAGIVVVTAGVYSAFRKKKTYKRVGTVSKLFVYPIKSCPGIEVESGEITSLGFKSCGVHDRSWLLVNKNNTAITIRQVPKLTLLDLTVSDDEQELILSAEDQPELKIPVNFEKTKIVESKVGRMDVQGYDCGEEAAEWFSTFIGGSYRLIQFCDDLPAKDIKTDSKFGHTVTNDQKSLFQDYWHFHLFSDASLRDLNTRLKEPASCKTFRPNMLVIDCIPHAEDRWRSVKIGEDAELSFTHYCSRCKVPTVNHDQGKFTSTEPITTLKEYRLCYEDDPDRDLHGNSPIFGVYLVTEKPGKIKVGDAVYALC